MTKIFLLVFIFINLKNYSEAEKCNFPSENQKLNCFKKEFQKLDKDLNKLYKELKQKIPKSLAEEMKTDSKRWISRKEFLCIDSRYTGDENSEKKNSTYYSCSMNFTESRIQYLKKAFGRENITSELAGTYDDNEGGKLIIKKNKAKFEFEISVVRGPTHHLGEVKGLFENKKIYTWENQSDEGECKLEFLITPYRIEIEEKTDCSSFKGANAYFTGIYRKIGK